MEEIRSKLLDYFRRETADADLRELLGYETDLLETRIIDSLNMMKNMLYLEKEFGLSMYDLDFDLTHFTSINTIASLVHQHLPAGVKQ